MIFKFQRLFRLFLNGYKNLIIFPSELESYLLSIGIIPPEVESYLLRIRIISPLEMESYLFRIGIIAPPEIESYLPRKWNHISLELES